LYTHFEVTQNVKLSAHKDTNLDDDYVEVRYRELTPAIHQIFQLCEAAGFFMLCEKEGATHNVDVNDVLYIEWVDNKCCVYTKDDVYVVAASLSQLEETLRKRHFIRASKMCLINIYKIRAVSNSLHFRLTAQLINNEVIIISRHYRNAMLAAINDLAMEVSP